MTLSVIVIIVSKRYHSTWCVVQGSCAISSNIYIYRKKITPKLKSQPLKGNKGCILFCICLRPHLLSYIQNQKRITCIYLKKCSLTWVVGMRDILSVVAGDLSFKLSFRRKLCTCYVI